MIFGKHINKYYFKYSYLFLIGILALGFIDYIQLIVPNLYQMVVNGLNNGVVIYKGVETEFDMQFLISKICMPMVFIVVLIMIGRIIWRVCFFGAAIKTETDIRNKMFDNAKDLDRDFYQTNKVGNLMSLFTNDLDTVQDCYGSGILMMCDALFLSTMAITKMWRMNPTLTIFALIPMALLAASSITVGKHMMKKWDYRQKCYSDLSDFAQESFSGIAVIKAFVKEAKELMAFKKINKDNEKANVDYTKTSVLLRILVFAFVESVVCIILGYGGYLVYRDIFNAGQLVEFVGYFSAIIWPIMAISELIDMTSRGKASLNRISELLDAKKTVVDNPKAKELTDPKGNIEFRNLTFKYPGAEINSLTNVSFKINAGESIGLVGRTGSGKTTVVDLILRTYNVPKGTVFIDGNDVNDLTVKSVRDACSYVPQDNFLFSDTIRNNIAFYNEELPDEEIISAAKAAGIHDDIIQFTDGYQTVLGERGVTVSGGQKQRISIARALIKNAPILILDDSVSAVDTKTEEIILGNLRQTRADKTTIIIAHRISTIAGVDKIIFIENGQISAVGTHNELYKTCPAYRRTVDLQKLEEKGGEGNE